MKLLSMLMALATFSVVNASSTNSTIADLTEAERSANLSSAYYWRDIYAHTSAGFQIAVTISQQIALFCLATGNADWCMNNDACKSMNLTLIGKICVPAQGLFLGLSSFFNSQSSAKQILIDQLSKRE